MELVADISWLSRISFLHSARHELENFRRRLRDGEDRDRFEEIVRAYSGMHREPEIKEPTTVEDIVGKCRARAESRGDAPLIDVHANCRDVTVDQKDAAVVASILDQLLSNSRSHSVINTDPFSVRVDSAVEAAGTVVSIRYASSAGKISEDFLPRVCVSPIPDANSTTYHFGLFLCAVQARMLGGRASARQDVPVNFRKAPLELAFEVPISIPKAGNVS